MSDNDVWVEIFDTYFGKKMNQYHENKESMIPDVVKDIISKIQEMSDESMSPEQIDKAFEEKMGVADETTEYNEGNIHYTKKVWVRDGGKFVRIIAKAADGIKYDDLSLEEKLEIAIQNEDYEKAAVLRDELDKINKVTVRESTKRVAELLEPRKKTIKKTNAKPTDEEPVKKKRRKKE